MENKIFTFLEESSGPEYRFLIDCALIECKYALLVIRDTMKLNSKGGGILEKLLPFLESKEQSSEWPGTQLIGRKATVFRFILGPDLAAIMKTEVNRLYQWQQPDFPKDLCFLRNDKSPWLVTIVHEKEGYFILSAEEKNAC